MILDKGGKMGSIFFCYFMHLTNLTTMKKWGKVKCNFADRYNPNYCTNFSIRKRNYKTHIKKDGVMKVLPLSFNFDKNFQITSSKEKHKQFSK